MGLFEDIISRTPIDKGWSGDKKYCITTTDIAKTEAFLKETFAATMGN